MKRISIISLLLFAVACSSPVEEYIKNDFARVVREDALDKEVQNEIDRITGLFEGMADEVNPEAKQAKELKSKATKLEKELYSRMNSYNRTGDYKYIINIANDADDCEAMQVRAASLEKKARPFSNHKDKQVKSLVQAIKNVDSKTLMNSVSLVKNDSITVENVFKKVFGSPAAMATPSEKEIEDFALALMTNYFAENQTQTVVAFKFQEKEDRWYIQLSNDTQYFLSAIECGDGKYSYKYIQVDDPFSIGSENMEE